MTTGKRNLIIAGSNKCGTTSLFRYLGAHPNTSLSAVKEARFFYKDMDADPGELCRRYDELFPGDSPATQVRVEASPTYLHGGNAVAQAIRRVYPDARMLFILRDPALRFVSYFKSKYGQPDSHVGESDFDEFAARALDAASSETGDLELRDRAARQELTMARYADFLPDFMDTFGSDQVGIFFFEDMLADPRAFMISVCEFAGLDPSTYEHYEFTVENRTRHHRNPEIRRIATQFNERFEKRLNQWPRLRQSLRGIYDLVNARPKSTIDIAGAALDSVYTFYAEPNARLRAFMHAHYPETSLPAWLV